MSLSKIMLLLLDRDYQYESNLSIIIGFYSNSLYQRSTWLLAIVTACLENSSSVRLSKSLIKVDR